jgi:Cd2+/Zn2+-exporting ATPase
MFIDPILRAWKEQGEISGVPDKVEELAGQGVTAYWEGKIIRIGKRDWISQNAGGMDHIMDSRGTSVYVALDSDYLGFISLSDEIRPDSAQALEALRSGGIKTIIMLTGDSRETAESVASVLNLDGFKADLMPHQKVEAVEDYIRKGRKTAFLGDGINDAPVLARADVGIAMGGLGSDAAIEAADIVLMADEPSRLVVARKIARKTRQIVVQNIVMALGIKAVILILAALGYAGMALAVFGDVGVALLAVLNVLRIMSDRESTSPKEHGKVLSHT